MKKIILFAIIVMGLGSISAQSLLKELRTGYKEVHRLQSTDTLKILAVMVEFQEDRYDATVGNGKFGSVYTQDYGDTIIDPLPHNAAYFSDHLEFAKNYYKKVSNGKVNIAYNVLPEVLTVSKYMRDYIPVYNSNDFTPLGNFAKEVWELADKKFANVRFSDYDLFVIFHAGVSSGIDLGSFTIDRNLPSIYLSPGSLKKIFGDQFNGFPVQNNSALINNTILMPETESRESTDIEGTIHLDEFSINGFLVSNIGSYLGLPDLLDTETGKSAIGRFGLMDSQGLNASFGMFPPEPSPWEKMYLGWEQPITVPLEDERIGIATRLSAVFNDTTLIKIPISSSEYFLVENRQQDARKDFVKITCKRSGSIYTKIVHPDSLGVYYITPDSLNGGVVIDVDEFDASVPGNGLVIWHIDENIINQNIADNRINAGDVKGVYVEEADGIFDIGQSFFTIFGDQVIGEGSNEDFWYKGNPAELYTNRFSSDTKPNSNSDTGAKSLITLENFSGISNNMSFDIKYGDELIKKIETTQTQFSSPLSISVPYNGFNTFNVLDGNKLLRLEGNSPEVLDLPRFSNIKQASISYEGSEYILGSVDDTVKFYIKSTATDLYGNFSIGTEITSPFVITIDNNELYGIAGTKDGSLIRIKLKSLEGNKDGYQYSISKIADDEITQMCKPFNDNSGYFSAITKTSVVDASSNKVVLPYNTIKAEMVYDWNRNNYSTIILTNNKRFYIINNGSIISEFEVESSGIVNNFSMLLDNKLGKQFIVLNNFGRIVVYNLNGSIVDNFPLNYSDVFNYTSTPITADINGDLVTDIIAISYNGNLHAFDGKTGKEIEPFPITVGVSSTVMPFIYKYSSPLSGSPVDLQAIAVIDKNNYLHSWIIGTNGQPNWGSEFGNSMNNSTVKVNQSEQVTSDFFPVDKAYNWPNPVYGSATNIRCYVDENSQVTIKIFDLTGDLVDQIESRAVGGFDNDIKWNVSNIQSGIYYAHLEVLSDSGKSASKIIKIAVIK